MLLDIELDLLFAFLSFCLGMIVIYTPIHYWPWISVWGIFWVVTILFWWYGFPLFIYWSLVEGFLVCLLGILFAAAFNADRLRKIGKARIESIQRTLQTLN